jgi:hypothetical protein
MLARNGGRRWRALETTRGVVYDSLSYQMMSVSLGRLPWTRTELTSSS